MLEFVNNSDAQVARVGHTAYMVAVFQNVTRIDVGGLHLEYEDHGQGDVLVLLHGLGCSAQDWGLQIPALSKHYRVIAPSLRGFGGSDKPGGPCSIMQYADDIVALLDALGIDRAHVLGHSMGGAVALQLAVAHQSRLDSLIVINSQASFAVRDWRRYFTVLMRFMMSGSAGMERLTRFLARRLFPHDNQSSLRAVMAERYSANDRRAYVAALQALAGWSVEDMVDTVTLPTLVLAGDNDVAPLERSQAFARRMPDASLEVVSDSGHASPFDQSDVVNKLVLDFLKTMRWGRRQGVRLGPAARKRAGFVDLKPRPRPH